MKKIIALLIAFFALSCNVADDSINDYQEFLPVISAEVPETALVNTTHNISLVYNKYTNCHIYNDLFYIEETHSNNIAVVSTNAQSIGNCIITNEEKEASFKFTPKATGDYTIKFWQGKDANNIDIYLTYTIEVTE